MKKVSIAISVASVSLIAIVGSANAQPVAPYPLYGTPNGGFAVTTGNELFASGGDVTVTYLGWQGAGYNEYLFVASPANPFGQFFENHTTPAGATMDLGSYPAGTEIEFGIHVVDTGDNWYDGPSTRNSDGAVHAYMVNDYEGQSDLTYVGFEDLEASVSDFNYLDEVYTFQGATSRAVPDMPGTLPLLGFCLTGLAAFGRRFRK